MINKTLLIACLVAGCAIVTTMSIVTQPMDDGAASFSAQIDANDLTLKTRNLPIQMFDDAV